jgi:hypothetical protein
LQFYLVLRITLTKSGDPQQRHPGRTFQVSADECMGASQRGHANGYTPKTISTKSGEIIFAIPQVQEGGFYPSAMEKGMIR